VIEQWDCNHENLGLNPGMEYELLKFILAPTALTSLRLRRSVN